MSQSEKEKNVPNALGGQNTVTSEIQETAASFSEYVIMGAEVEGKTKVFEVVSETTGSGAGTSAQAHIRKNHIQQQIEQVHKMSEPQLRNGIAKELNKTILTLKKEAHKIEHRIQKFSAYELNTVLAKIRANKEQIANLMLLALEKLRELYITLVLKLKVVTV